jgi:hypothetical protein
VNDIVLWTHLLTGVESAAHDAAEDVEAGGVLGGVLLGRVDHEPPLRVTRHHVLVALRVARPAVHLLHLTLQFLEQLNSGTGSRSTYRT